MNIWFFIIVVLALPTLREGNSKDTGFKKPQKALLRLTVAGLFAFVPFTNAYAYAASIKITTYGVCPDMAILCISSIVFLLNDMSGLRKLYPISAHAYTTQGMQVRSLLPLGVGGKLFLLPAFQSKDCRYYYK